MPRKTPMDAAALRMAPNPADLETKLHARQTEPPSGDAGTRLLVKIRRRDALSAADPRAGLRPLFEASPGGRDADGFGLDGGPDWYLAELPDPSGTAWDSAHARVADQLGIDGSDVLFVEPDLVHDIYLDPDGREPDQTFDLVRDCKGPRQTTEAVVVGPTDRGWHLDEAFTQLRTARDEVAFTDERTRIAILDTGYDRDHVGAPRHVLRHLERSFVESDATRTSAEDPDGKAFPIDNSGHGTGTLGILAGGPLPEWDGDALGGAPDADVVPLRIADSVVLLKTSAFARALDYAVSAGCDVVSMSMGGLPSRAWRETVDRAYENGVFLATAAGNNYNGLPSRNLVYPARYGRVVAVCGAMADGRAYADIDGWRMEGNYGPGKKMETAMAAYTPNIPWPVFGCSKTVRLNGGGTSAATPQVAAAAALWYEKYKGVLPRDWRRVEAARHALFSTARKGNRKQFGQGILRAHAALGVRPRLGLDKTASDKDWFALFRVLTGLGFAEMPPREQMLNVELTQRWLLNPALQELVEDPEDAGVPGRAKLRKILEAVIEDEGASRALRQHVAGRYAVVTGKSRPLSTTPREAERATPPAACESPPPVPRPSVRKLRAYAVDPSLSTRLETAGTNEVTLAVRWEDLKPGPEGEYLKVVDLDPPDSPYPQVDLNDPSLLAQEGWKPSEGNPQFHQQMVYAVAMRTLSHFEEALGRPALWRPKGSKGIFVQHLEIHPHALRQANAHYSPRTVTLEFGYFDAEPSDPGVLVPGSRIYTCLSHDIIAHETTHALLDGMHRRFREATNPDVLAFHEAFADVVALLQHFTLEECLRAEIARTRGDLSSESRLGSLAVQLGMGMGREGALRQAIGRVVDGEWQRLEPDATAMERILAPHARGAILVAAVFDAFLAVYRQRTADLFRIYTGGTGVLPEGAIHPDLVRRLAHVAASTARCLLTMCIRALDYLPPVDVTFFEYLRALITADMDVWPDDEHDYRVALVEAFRRRGIHPDNRGRDPGSPPRTLSVDSLRWRGLMDLGKTKAQLTAIGRSALPMLEDLKDYAEACTYVKSRRELFDRTAQVREAVRNKLAEAVKEKELASVLGIDPDHPFEVQEIRRALRIPSGGSVSPEVIVNVVQTRKLPANPDDGTPAHTFSGGATLVVDLAEEALKYVIFKRVGSQSRRLRTAHFVRELAQDPLRDLFLGGGSREPFAALHALADEGV
ncbi:MAG TPA: S8 family serine peptidase [Longimicrobiales bacterium]|nr:S8 family serine peptidase [Longimicrobiales bacterium]